MPLAASLERAVTDSAELLLAVGAVLAIAYALLRTRIGVLRWPLIAAALLALGAGTALGGWAWHEKRPRDVVGLADGGVLVDAAHGHGTDREEAEGQEAEDRAPVRGAVADLRVRHAANPPRAPGWRHLRPPFHGLWKLKAHADIEFPPSVAYGKVYVAQQKGRFFALNARTGQIVWTKHFEHCSAASPTISDGIVYQAYMHELPCRKHETGAAGFVVAWNARNGKEYWRVRAGSVESSPLLIGKTLYFGSWDRHLYSYRIRGKRKPLLKWTFTADDQIVAAPAQAGRVVVIATSSGSVYGVDAKTGRQRWHSTSFSRFGRREYFYATPTVAYGRVYIGNADGTVYAFGASSGHLLWARQVGTYVYYGCRGLAEDRVRRDLGRDVHRPRRANGRRRVGGSTRRHRSPDAPTVLRGAGLLLDVRPLRRGRPAAREGRPARHLGA